MFEWFLIENEGILVFSFLKTFDLLNFYSYRIVQCPQKLPSKIDNNNCHPKVTEIKWPPFPSLGIFIRIGALLDYRSVFSKMYSICVFLALWVLLRANIGFNGLVVSNVEFYTPPDRVRKSKNFPDEVRTSLPWRFRDTARKPKIFPKILYYWILLSGQCLGCSESFQPGLG